MNDELDEDDASIECCDGTQIIERQGPRGKAETVSGDGRERQE